MPRPQQPASARPKAVSFPLFEITRYKGATLDVWWAGNCKWFRGKVAEVRPRTDLRRPPTDLPPTSHRPPTDLRDLPDHLACFGRADLPLISPQVDEVFQVGRALIKYTDGEQKWHYLWGGLLEKRLV